VLSSTEEIIELGKRATLVAALKEAWNDLRILHRHPVFVTSIWGYVPVHAVLGAMSFWGPKVWWQLSQLPTLSLSTPYSQATEGSCYVSSLCVGVCKRHVCLRVCLCVHACVCVHPCVCYVRAPAVCTCLCVCIHGCVCVCVDVSVCMYVFALPPSLLPTSTEQ
jgi:hypothetical protein